MKNHLSDPHCRYTSLALGKSPITASAALVRRPKKPSHNYFTIWKKRVQLKAITTFKGCVDGHHDAVNWTIGFARNCRRGCVVMRQYHTRCAIPLLCVCVYVCVLHSTLLSTFHTACTSFTQKWSMLRTNTTPRQQNKRLQYTLQILLTHCWIDL